MVLSIERIVGPIALKCTQKVSTQQRHVNALMGIDPKAKYENFHLMLLPLYLDVS